MYMQYRTDLAIEMLCEEECSGIEHTFEDKDMLRIDRIFVKNEAGEKAAGKKRGNYITLTMPPLGDSITGDDEKVDTLAEEIVRLIPKEGTVLVVGLGNTSITPDAVGPLATEGILATRHIIGEFKRIAGMDNLRSAAVIAPGVLGQTGIEAAEIIRSLTDSIKPSAVIVIDALAARSLSRLGCTVQLCNTGINPGAGVGNNRPEINEQSLGVPVIAIGVPTVADASTMLLDTAESMGASEELLSELEEKAQLRETPMIVTPREIDLIVKRGARLIALAVNLALHPDYDPVDLYDSV